MKNNFGTNISWTLFGESHGPAIGITLDRSEERRVGKEC